MSRKALKEKYDGLIVQLDEIMAKAETEGRFLDADEQKKFEDITKDAVDLKTAYKSAESNFQMLESLKSSLGDIDVIDLDKKNDGGGGTKSKGFKTAGDLFTEDQFLKAWSDQLQPDSKADIGNSPTVKLGGMKDILSSGGTGPVNSLVREDWRGLVDQGTFQRPLSFYDLVTKTTTNSDLITFAKITGFTNNAAPVPEATGVEPYVAGAGQVSGIKPQSSLILAEDSTRVVTIAHWFAATRRALADVGQLRTLIDTFLRYGLDEEREDQMVNGDGTGENLLGFLNTSGTQSQPWDTNLLVTARKSITKVRTIGRGRPTAFLFSPADNERFDLLTDANGQFYFGGPSQIGEQKFLWGLPRIECEAMPDGTGAVADWRWWVAYDRSQATIRVSEHHANFFIRNMAAVLGEFSMGFAGHAPIKTVEIDLTA